MTATPDSPPKLAAGMPQHHYEQTMARLLPAIESALTAATESCSGESTTGKLGPGCPQRLGDAIRYAVLAPGKRLRPALVLMAAEACGGTIQQALPGAVAVEMIHAYSLIHDDLPAMDDDDLRRGRPTVHIKFDQATAILAGDALQPLAFQQLAECGQSGNAGGNPQHLIQAIAALALAAGPENLAGGQADDLACESGHLPAAIAQAAKNIQQNQASQAERKQTQAFLESIHRRKTGALFSVSLRIGGLLAGADSSQLAALEAYAAEIGLAFQVVDDLLDHTAAEADLGKRVGKDIERGKLTYPGLLGLPGAREFAGQLVQRGKERLAPFGQSADALCGLADFVLSRTR
ncbi:polyprenyl synthetase family protein [Stieleria bergensis]